MQYFSNDDEQFALSKFESMLRSNKVYFFDSDEFEEIVYYYMDSGKMNLAKKAIELSLTQHPSSIHLKLIKVELLIFENKFNLAEKLFQSLEHIDPTLDEIYIQKASILSKNNNHSQAIGELKKALSLTEDKVDVHALLGMEHLFINEFDTARESFEYCLSADIEDYSALYNIIYCFDMLEKSEEAICFLNNYIDKNPYSEVAWHQLGREYAFVNKFTEAIRALDYAIIIDELFVGAYFEKAAILESQGKYKEAIYNYMMTLKLDDPTAFTYLQIARCYESMEDYKLAIKYYHKTIDEDPIIDKGWLLLTNSYLHTNNPEKALCYIQKALEIDADNYDFINRAAEIYIRLNLFEEAANFFKKSLALGDDRIELYLALIDVLHFIGDYNEAYQVLINAKIKYPNRIEIAYRLSGINFLLGKDKEAFFYLEESLKSDFQYHKKMKELFPTMFANEQVKQLIVKFEKN